MRSNVAKSKAREEKKGGILIVELFDKGNTFYYYLKGVKVFFYLK